MTTIAEAAPNSRAMTWGGWALTILVTLFFLMDAGMKLATLPIVLETQATLGWPAPIAQPLGIILLVCTLLYIFPRTAVLGALLATAYLGGAVATHVRIGSPLFSHVLFGVYLGLAMWAGLWLRSPALRALVPLVR